MAKGCFAIPDGTEGKVTSITRYDKERWMVVVTWAVKEWPYEKLNLPKGEQIFAKTSFEKLEV